MEESHEFVWLTEVGPWRLVMAFLRTVQHLALITPILDDED